MTNQPRKPPTRKPPRLPARMRRATAPESIPSSLITNGGRSKVSTLDQSPGLNHLLARHSAIIAGKGDDGFDSEGDDDGDELDDRGGDGADGDDNNREPADDDNDNPEPDDVTLRGTAVYYERISNAFSTQSSRVLIRRGAFDASVNNPDADICCLHAGKTDEIIGRTTAGTLKVRSDYMGVHYEAFGPPKVDWMDDLLISVQRRDVSSAGVNATIQRAHREVINGEKVLVVDQARLRFVSVEPFGDWPGSSTAIGTRPRQSPASTTSTSGPGVLHPADVGQFDKEFLHRAGIRNQLQKRNTIQ